jgi:hypothetical protein
VRSREEVELVLALAKEGLNHSQIARRAEDRADSLAAGTGRPRPAAAGAGSAALGWVPGAELGERDGLSALPLQQRVGRHPGDLRGGVRPAGGRVAAAQLVESVRRQTGERGPARRVRGTKALRGRPLGARPPVSGPTHVADHQDDYGAFVLDPRTATTSRPSATGRPERRPGHGGGVVSPCAACGTVLPVATWPGAWVGRPSDDGWGRESSSVSRGSPGRRRRQYHRGSRQEEES